MKCAEKQSVIPFKFQQPADRQSVKDSAVWTKTLKLKLQVYLCQLLLGDETLTLAHFLLMFCKRVKSREGFAVCLMCYITGSMFLQICLHYDPVSLSAALATPADTPSGTSRAVNQTHLHELLSVYSLQVSEHGSCSF